jgi:ketosteroid isomerase-like protein
MHLYLKLCLAVWVVATALIQDPTGMPRGSADAMELSRLENVWNEAHVRGDADALDRLWADDFVVTVPDMPVMTKSEVIKVWRSGQMKFQRYQTSDTRIRVYDDAAVITGRLQRTRNFKGRDVDDDWRFTKVCIRRGGRWQVVSWQASPLTQ